MKKLKFDILATLAFVLAVMLISRLGLPCVFYALTGLPCPACHMTRAALCLLRLDFSGAFYHHPLVFLLPVIYILFLLRHRASDRVKIAVSAGIGVLFLAVYLIRLLFIPSSAIYTF